MNIMLIGAAVGSLGLICILARKTLVGVLIGVQLLILGGAMTFVLAGVTSGARVEGFSFGLLIVLSGVAQVVAGNSLAVRLFQLKNRVVLDDLRSLRR
jgi:NADH:ubiquinone oxidoreductase subunit K